MNVMYLYSASWMFFHVGSIPVLRSELGSPSNTSIILDNVVCSGGESDLLECDYISTGSISCDRSYEAGVRCGGRLDYVLVFPLCGN